MSLEAKSPAGQASIFPPTPVPGEPVTPPSKAGRRSFWDMLVMEGGGKADLYLLTVSCFLLHSIPVPTGLL